MFWIFLASQLTFAAGPDVKKLMGECYDGNSASACLRLSEKLALEATPTDHDRSILARHRACILGDQSACLSEKKPTVEADKIEVMKVKRSEIATELSDMPTLLQAARLEGREQGFEFVHIEPKSAYERLGFKIGDVLLEINGHALHTSTQAMELFVLLRSETDFTVRLKRDGKLMDRKYQVVN